MTLFRGSVFPDQFQETDFNALFNWVNGFSDVLTFTVVTGGTEVSVPHTMELIPSHAAQVTTQLSTGQGAVIPGTTPWTVSAVYLTATVPGVYSVILRR